MKKQKKTIKEEIEEVIDTLIKDVHYEHTYPAHTAYYQLDFDKMRNALKGFSRKLLQRFIEETKIEKKKVGEMPDNLLGNFKNLQIALQQVADDGYNHALKDIHQKQQQWLKENL